MQPDEAHAVVATRSPLHGTLHVDRSTSDATAPDAVLSQAAHATHPKDEQAWRMHQACQQSGI